MKTIEIESIKKIVVRKDETLIISVKNDGLSQLASNKYMEQVRLVFEDNLPPGTEFIVCTDLEFRVIGTDDESFTNKAVV